MSQHPFASLVVVFQALLVWIASDSWNVPISAIIIVVFRLLPSSWTLGVRTCQACAVIVGLGCLILAGLSPHEVNIEGSVYPVSWTLPLANYLLLVQALILSCATFPQRLPKYYPALVLVTCLSSFNQTILPREKAMFFALTVAAGLSCVSVGATEIRPNLKRNQQTRHRRRVIYSAVVACMIPSAWILIGTWETTVTAAQRLLPHLLAQTDGPHRGARSYVRTGNLHSVTAEQQQDPMHVALRVYSQQAPGYLRGRVFDTYDRRQWSSASRHRGKWNRIGEKQYRSSLPSESFAVAAGEGVFNVGTESMTAGNALVRFEVHNDPQRGDVFFIPLSTTYLQGTGSYVALDDHGVVHAGMDTTQPYTAYALPASRTYPQKLPPDLRHRLVQPLRGIDPGIRELSDQVCGRANTPQEKMKAVASFFQSGFRYTFEPMQLPQNVEPLSYFLQRRIAAHCEFFASGAVALLRFQQIPCRYVTGYVVTELESEYGDYWIARNRSAHAWVEAYDETSERWIVVEATPGMNVITKTRTRNSDDLSAANAAARTRGDTNHRSWLLYRWLRHGWGWIKRRLKMPLLLIGLVMAVCIGVARRRGHAAARHPDHRVARMQRLLARADRRLRRRKLSRQPHETLHQFAERIRHHAGDADWPRRCADWYVEYANLRYGTQARKESLPHPP